MIYIYILQLEYGKYYVGKTNNPRFRLDNHFNSNGSAWTKKYKPVKILELIPNCDDYDEDKITRQCMDKYGIHNVRGGSFVSVCEYCEKEFRNEKKCEYHEKYCNSKNKKKIVYESYDNRCFRCGRDGHYASSCYASKHIDGYYL